MKKDAADTFPKRVLAAVRRIPRGKVATYGQIADRAGSPRAARMVAGALNHGGPGLPWHRVVGAGGRISLPGEFGLEQRIRLEAEGVTFNGSRVVMEKHALHWGHARRSPR